MARTDDEVIDELRAIYREEFGGKRGQRFLISWSDLRALYGFSKLYDTRVARLTERAAERHYYIFDLGEGEQGHLLAVLRRRTPDRWRKVPRTIIRNHLPPAVEAGADTVEDDDDE